MHEIVIDEEVIREAIAGNINRNPVALAMAKAGWKHPQVQLHRGGFLYSGHTPNGRFEQMMLPEPIKDWLTKYESGFHMEPTSFKCPAKLDS